MGVLHTLGFELLPQNRAPVTEAQKRVAAESAWTIPMVKEVNVAGEVYRVPRTISLTEIRPTAGGGTAPEPLGVMFLSYGFWPTVEELPLVEDFLAWTFAVASLMRPIYGWGGGEFGLFGTELQSPDPVAIVRVTPQPLEWPNVFGPEYMKAIGRERLRAAPAWRIEILPDHAAAVVLSPHPSQVSEVIARSVATILGVPLPPLLHGLL